MTNSSQRQIDEASTNLRAVEGELEDLRRSQAELPTLLREISDRLTTAREQVWASIRWRIAPRAGLGKESTIALVIGILGCIPVATLLVVIVARFGYDALARGHSGVTTLTALGSLALIYQMVGRLLAGWNWKKKSFGSIELHFLQGTFHGQDGQLWLRSQKITSTGLVETSLNAGYEAIPRQWAVYLTHPEGGGLITLDPETGKPFWWYAKNYLAATFRDRLASATARELAPYLGAWAERLTKALEGQQRAKLLEVRRQELVERLECLKTHQTAWVEVFLPDDVRAQLESHMSHFAAGRGSGAQGLLLYGPPGTGKTLIARQLAAMGDAKFMPLKLADLKQGYIGQSGQRVKEVWKEARQASRTVMFIDECDATFARRGSADGDSFTVEMVSAFLAEWDGVEGNSSNVLVVGATNRRELLDDAAIQRFGTLVEISLPTRTTAPQILARELAKRGLSPTLPPWLGEKLIGLSGRDLSKIADQLDMVRGGRAVTEDDVRTVLEKLRGRSSTEVSADATWDRLILPSDTFEHLKELAELYRGSPQLEALGISADRALLLYGPPGTGKTQIARTLANEAGISFMALTTAELKAQFLGQSGHLVKQAFERARGQSPCLIFIDEIDIVAPQRTGAGDQLTQEIVGQLLQELDGIKRQTGKVYLLAATNHAEGIDPAVRSRFTREMEIPLPDAECRARLVADLLAGKPLAAGEDILPTLVAKTAGQSGRAIKQMIEIALRSAYRARSRRAGEIEIRLEDFPAENARP